jgi:hypothetical protein
MESKIFMDIDANGKPQIRIDLKRTNDGSDVRDKLIGRFLFDIMYGDKKEVDVSMEYGHHDDNSTVAFIRLKSNAS